MRTSRRTRGPLPAHTRALRRDAAAIAAAMVAVGASFGAITISYGLPTWVPFLMSTVVFAGGARRLPFGLAWRRAPFVVVVLAAAAAAALLRLAGVP